VDEPPRRPDDDDWESRLPDEYAPIPDPRPKTLLRVTALVVVAALVITAAPVAFRLIFGGSAEPPPPGQGVIEGVVLSGPQCPVLIAGSPCPDEPVATEISVTDRSAGQVVGVARSGADGRFRILLPPGDYTLQAGSTTKPFPRGIPFDVAVSDGDTAKVQLRVDTGIR
jgi:hypothetical protein